MNLDATQVAALCDRFHARAKALSRKADASVSRLEVGRLNAAAATLQWAAQELSRTATHLASGERARSAEERRP